MASKITLYTVVSMEDRKKTFTTTLSKEQAFEYIKKRLKLDHLNHFEAWCKLRNTTVTDEAAWETYLATVLSHSQKNVYGVVKVKFPLTTLAGILRSFCGYMPIGCSFDQDLEWEQAASIYEQIVKGHEQIAKKESTNGNI